MVDICEVLWVTIFFKSNIFQQLVKFHSLGGNSEETVGKSHTSFIPGLKPQEILLAHILVPAIRSR